MKYQVYVVNHPAIVRVYNKSIKVLLYLLIRAK